MDGLITILILFGLYAMRSSSKKKKARQQAAQQRAFAEAGEAMQQGKMPFSKDEWKTYLKEQAKNVIAESASENLQGIVEKPKAKAENPLPAAIKAEPPKLLPILEHDEPEGTVSTQGESAAEHAEHRRKVLAEEARQLEEHEALKELREMNLKKLRTAVVMREILDKPVSLRPRGYR